MADYPLQRNSPVARHRAARGRAVAEHIVAHLDQPGQRQGAAEFARQVTLEPAGAEIDGHADPGEFGQADRIVQGVGDVDVGVEQVGGFHRQGDAARTGQVAAGRDQFGEAGGGFLPAEPAASTGDHVDVVRAVVGGVLDRRQKQRGRAAGVLFQVGL